MFGPSGSSPNLTSLRKSAGRDVRGPARLLEKGGLGPRGTWVLKGTGKEKTLMGRPLKRSDHYGKPLSWQVEKPDQDLGPKIHEGLTHI